VSTRKTNDNENPTRIYLVRHGAAEGAGGIVVGQVDLPLSDAGAESVRELAATWCGDPPDRLLASDLARATGTAEILGERWGLGVKTDPRLREMAFGDWDGQRWSDVRDNHGPILEEWMGAWWHRRVPGGEGLHDVADRARKWLDDVLAENAGGTVVAVAHGGSIRTLLCHVLELPLERAFHLRLDHGLVSGLATSFRGLEVWFTNADRFPATLCDGPQLSPAAGASGSEAEGE